MNDIQRWDSASGYSSGNCTEQDDGGFVHYEDHIKAMEAKESELRDCRSLLDFKREDIRVRDEQIAEQAKEIENLKAHEKQLETGFDKQARVIERLNEQLAFLKTCVRNSSEKVSQNIDIEILRKNSELTK